MIKLTINPDGDQPSTYTFEHQSFTIGSSDATDDNICLEGLEKRHLEVRYEEDRYLLRNLIEDDSTTTLNGGAFDETVLEQSHELVVGDYTIAIAIETTVQLAAPGIGIDDAEDEFDVEEELLKLDALFSDEETDDDADVAELDIDKILEEVLAIDDEPTAESEEAAPQLGDPDDPSLIEFCSEEEEEEFLELIGDLEEEVVSIGEKVASTAAKSEADEEIILESHIRGGVEDYETLGHTDLNFEDAHIVGSTQQKLLQVAVVLIAMTGILAIGTYLSVSKSNRQHEQIAARGLADITMAVAHAQVSNEQPDHGKWHDADFINEHLAAVLSSKYRARSVVTPSASLGRSPYRLRVTASDSGSQFLLVAEPIGGAWQWLIPKRGLYVYSGDMIMHATRDFNSVKQASRLAKNGDIPAAIAQSGLSQDSKKVTLADLDAGHPEQGYTPPEELKDTAPHAVDRLYNAPRYYRFGKELVEKVIAAGRTFATDADAVAAKAAIQDFSNYPYLVLYSPRGYEAAIETATGLTALKIEQAFPVGFIAFAPETGLIKGKELLTSATQLDQLIPPPRAEEATAAATTAAVEPTEVASVVTTDALPKQPSRESDSADVDLQHPLFRSLSSLASSQASELAKVNSALVDLLAHGDEGDLETFRKNEKELTAQREAIVARHREEAAKKIAAAHKTFTRQYGDTPETARTFAAYVTAAEFEKELPTPVAKSSERATEVNVIQETEQLLRELNGSADLEELHRVVVSLSSLLNQGLINDSEAQLDTRSKLRRHTLDKVGEFLLSPAAGSNTEMYTTRNRTLLTEVLNAAQIGELQEKEFYLREFDLLVEKYKMLSRDPMRTDVATASKSAIQKQIASVPMNAITSADLEDDRNKGRLGQQIVVHESGQAPTADRDDKLNQAIGLLTQATDDNRSFWQDILEARRLLTETPKQQVLDSIQGSLGFFQGEQTLFKRMRTTMKGYIFALQELGAGYSDGEYAVKLNHFRSEQAGNLEEILSESREVQQRGHDLLNGMDEYIGRTEAYLADYEAARRKGFFAQNGRYHTLSMAQLQRKLKQAKALRPKIQKASEQIVETGKAYAMMAERELANLDREVPPSVDESFALEQRHSSTSYPNLTADNLGGKLTKMLNWEVSPVPR